MDKSLLVGCDEFTVVLHLHSLVDAKDWEGYAEDFIEEFLEKSRMEELFGGVVTLYSKIPSGYTQGWTIDRVTWYFAIAMHEHFQKMGVCVRFSAEAWAWYQKKYTEQFGEDINVAVFYQMIQSDIYETRITRIDLTADYFNYDDSVSPNSIHESLINQSLLVMDCKGRVARRKITHYGKDGIVESILIGSKKENTKSLCRIYDKRLEQISKCGFRLEEAMSCESWIRFEASYRGSYAWQIAEDLLEITDKAELSSYIASKITDKYRFYDVNDDNYANYTNNLLNIINDKDYSSLRSENPKDNALWQSIKYIMDGSGLFSTMYKINYIWDDDAVIRFLKKLYYFYSHLYSYKACEDRKLIAWCEKHYQELHDMDVEDCFYEKKFN